MSSEPIADSTLDSLSRHLVFDRKIRWITPEVAATAFLGRFEIAHPLDLETTMGLTGSTTGADITCHWLPPGCRGFHCSFRPTGYKIVVVDGAESFAEAKITLFHEVGELLLESLERICHNSNYSTTLDIERWATSFACSIVAPRNPFKHSALHHGFDIPAIGRIWGFSLEETLIRLEDSFADDSVWPPRYDESLDPDVRDHWAIWKEAEALTRTEWQARFHQRYPSHLIPDMR